MTIFKKASRSIVIKAIAIVLALVPFVLAIVAWMAMDADPERGEFAVVERWRDKAPKILLREWTRENVRFSEMCHITPKGEEIGCGIEKAGAPWEGVMVEWYQYDLQDPHASERYGVPRAMKSYREGKPHGIWKVFYATGALSSEMEYKDGRQESWKLYDPQGHLIRTINGAGKP